MNSLRLKTEAAKQHATQNEQSRFLIEMANTVSDEMSQRGFWGKVGYLLKEAGIRETLFQYFTRASHEVKDETGAYARIIVRSKVHERTSNIIKRTRMHDWYDWMTTSSEVVIRRMIPKIEAVVRAKFSKQTEARENSSQASGAINP